MCTLLTAKIYLNDGNGTVNANDDDTKTNSNIDSKNVYFKYKLRIEIWVESVLRTHTNSNDKTDFGQKCQNVQRNANEENAMHGANICWKLFVFKIR